jgi:hypothetical protein
MGTTVKFSVSGGNTQAPSAFGRLSVGTVRASIVALVGALYAPRSLLRGAFEPQRHD